MFKIGGIQPVDENDAQRKENLEARNAAKGQRRAALIERKPNVRQLTHKTSSKPDDLEKFATSHVRFGGSDVMIPVEVAEDIDNYMRHLEVIYAVPEDFLRNIKSPIHGRMRQILADWLYHVQSRFTLLNETLSLSINLMDRSLLAMNGSITKTNLQLLGVTCLFISSKFEEITVPNVEDFVIVAGSVFNKEDIFHMEMKFCLTKRGKNKFYPRFREISDFAYNYDYNRQAGSINFNLSGIYFFNFHFSSHNFFFQILSALDFNLGAPHSLQFLRRYRFYVEPDSRTYQFAKYICEVASVCYSLAHYLPSTVAATAIWLASYTFGRTLVSNFLFDQVFKLDQATLFSTARLFVDHVINFANPDEDKIYALREKYQELVLDEFTTEHISKLNDFFDYGYEYSGLSNSSTYSARAILEK
ncbi:unnamed protein product [Meloidogyne enterolobii]|uniref:Uncharacterized protein n=1 Tax=Meloidogyne enterolobii TaxID=390850 RepID=A0ACB1A769_MELEN